MMKRLLRERQSCFI